MYKIYFQCSPSMCGLPVFIAMQSYEARIRAVAQLEVIHDAIVARPLLFVVEIKADYCNTCLYIFISFFQVLRIYFL